MILVNLQGVFLFLFHCVRSKDVRKEWQTVVGGSLRSFTRTTQVSAETTTETRKRRSQATEIDTADAGVSHDAKDSHKARSTHDLVTEDLL